MAYKERSPLPHDRINTKDHLAVGLEWSVVGSKGDQYSITMHHKGWTCSCPAFQMRGLLCKHINTIVDRLDPLELN